MTDKDVSTGLHKEFIRTSEMDGSHDIAFSWSKVSRSEDEASYPKTLGQYHETYRS